MTFAGSLTKRSTVGLECSVELHCRTSGSLREVQGEAFRVNLNFRGLQEVFKDMMCAKPWTALLAGPAQPLSQAGRYFQSAQSQNQHVFSSAGTSLQPYWPRGNFYITKKKDIQLRVSRWSKHPKSELFSNQPAASRALGNSEPLKWEHVSFFSIVCKG